MSDRFVKNGLWPKSDFDLTTNVKVLSFPSSVFEVRTLFHRLFGLLGLVTMLKIPLLSLYFG